MTSGVASGAGRGAFWGFGYGPRVQDAALPSGPEVIVIGGGLFGCLLTHRLTVRGVRVLLLEADDLGARAARERLVLDPGLQRLDVELAARSRRTLAMLAAQAPHLCRPTTAIVATEGGARMQRTLATLELHDRCGEGPLAQARAVAGCERLSAPIALSASCLSERRIVLALALSALARGADVRTGASANGVRPRGEALEVELDGGAVRAPFVVLATGGDASALLDGDAKRPSLLPSAPLEHALELLLRPVLSEHAFVDARGPLRLEHVPMADASFVRLTSMAPIDLLSALGALGRAIALPSLEVHDQQLSARHEGPVVVRRGSLRGLFTVTGNELVTAHHEVQRLAHEIAQTLGRVSAPDAGDDARLEDGVFDVTPAIERTRLGAEILGVLAARHGERASAIAERVMHAPREGAIVCPCRAVIEAELRHAHREELARDLRALARRTELGTGACAGVRCAHRAAAVLGEEALRDPSGEAAIVFLRERAAAAHLDAQRARVLGELREGMARAAGLPPILEDVR